MKPPHVYSRFCVVAFAMIAFLLTHAATAAAQTETVLYTFTGTSDGAVPQSLVADAGRGDLLKTIIDRVELRPNGLRMILSLVPLTPAAAPPNRLQGCVFTREFPLRIKRRGVEMRFAIDASDPRATNPDPVLLKEVKRARYRPD